MELRELERETWAGYELDFSYDTDSHLDVRMEEAGDELRLTFVRRPFAHTRHKTASDELFQPYWADMRAFGLFEGERLCAAIETGVEDWCNRLRVTEMWVDAPYRRRGLGRRLMDRAKALAIETGRRALVVETQSSNENALAFYRAQGFRLAGFDAFAYSNADVERGEVRLDLIYLFAETISNQ